jgi:hypothetical protein
VATLLGIALAGATGLALRAPSVRHRRPSPPPSWTSPGACCTAATDIATALEAATQKGHALLHVGWEDPELTSPAGGLVKSVAENTVDAVVAPACWAAVLGAPACWPTGR